MRARVVAEAAEIFMADGSTCQRPGCDSRGKERELASPADGSRITVRLCDQDYRKACSEKPPVWLTELLKHIGLVG